jgi:hypothetical protein
VLLQVGVVERASQASHRFGPARSSWSSYRARTVAAMTSPVRPRSTGPSSRDVSSIPSVASAVAAALRSCSSFLPLDAEQVVDADLGGARVVTNSPVGFVPDDPDEALGPKRSWTRRSLSGSVGSAPSLAGLQWCGRRG